jgi:Putative beta-barrel porin-2, OmpL-like. bbp2
MFNALALLAALALGQPGSAPQPGLPPPRPNVTIRLEDEAPQSLPVILYQAPADQPQAAPAPPAEPKPFEVTAPVLPPPAPPLAPTAPAAPAPTPPDRWLFMKAVQGTWAGSMLDDNRMGLWGWCAGSYNASSAAHNNQPVVWTDRANDPMLQQFWMRWERTVVTSGTSTPTWGFRSDWLIGTDYRFTLPRELWESQLVNSAGNQNLYGVDPVQFYLEGYIPTFFQGLDIKAGRFFTPFGYESIEAISTPLMSRSYAFNWSPPFTHFGVLTTTTVTPVWTVQAGLVNGNDTFIGPTDEARFVGTLKWTQPGGRNVVTFGTSVGRGKFNAGEPFAPATLGLSNEPAGHNNINVFDLVWTHQFNGVLNYALEMIYGYQTNVPANVAGGLIKENATEGTAHWGSIVNYLAYTISPQWSCIGRFEVFDDFEGQRTGFEGVYEAVTAGVQWRPRKSVIVRPEVRFDYNDDARPFEGKHWLFTAGGDVILRW